MTSTLEDLGSMAWVYYQSGQLTHEEEYDFEESLRGNGLARLIKGVA